MITIHQIFYQNAQDMNQIPEESVDLVITSPPYPIIEMWDDLFRNLDPNIVSALNSENGNLTFDLMHQQLDKVWIELYRVLKQGGIVCINIGDAVRTFNKKFSLYPNHSRIIQVFREIGFDSLPVIVWSKPTNAPNKFMGSGMLPPSAYVTLEHEYLLIFRKGNKREFFLSDEKVRRRHSAFFWKERNSWFSDLWDLKGVSQHLSTDSGRDRSASFPFDLAYRLVNMFSIQEDLILDPFLGTGTTCLAAIVSGRNSIGIELDDELAPIITEKLQSAKKLSESVIKQRITNHKRFIEQQVKNGRELKYRNEFYGFPVMTKQESQIEFQIIDEIQIKINNTFEVFYELYKIP